MAQPIHPHNGARFQIDRVKSSSTTAQYQVQIYVVDGFYQWRLLVSTETPDMAWEPEESPNPPTAPMPSWMKKHTEALMRPFVQNAKREGTWGRRIRRWRDASEPSTP